MPNYDNVTLTTPDHVKITGYLIKYGSAEETKQAPTVFFLHVRKSFLCLFFLSVRN